MTEEVKKKKRRLSDIDFSGSGAHIAAVGALVGGPANMQEIVIWKSKGTGHITEADLEAVIKSKATPEEVALEKAKFNSEVRGALSEKLNEQFATGYEWLYLEDFSDSEIVFFSDAGIFVVSYSLSGEDEYVLGDTAIGIEYESVIVENGSLKLSKKAQEKLNEGVYSLVTKALDNPETNERIKNTLNTKIEKAKLMQEEIQKAVELVKAEHAEKIASMEVELTKARDALAVVEATKKEQLMKARQDQVAKFDKDGAEALVKATEVLDDEAFALIVKAFDAKVAIIEESDLMKQVGHSATEVVEEESKTAALMKAKYAPKQ